MFIGIDIVDGAGRTGFFAVAAFVFGQFDAVFGVNGVFQGYGLGIGNVDGLSFDQLLVIDIIHFPGAFFRARPAGNAFFHVHIAGFLEYRNLEISLFPAHFLNLGQGQELDIDMPSNFHQLGRHDAHGAIVGGKCFIELGHNAADGRRFFDHIDVISRIGQIQRGLNGADPSADNQDGSRRLF